MEVDVGAGLGIIAISTFGICHDHLRFIYVHTPSRYLTIEEKIVDVIEESRTLADGNTADFQGWDLRKALKLLREGNPVLGEWYEHG